TKFQEEMGYADVLPITRTYRNAQELIDIAGDFIQQNPSQFKKRLISPKSIRKPIVIFSYSDDYKKNPIRGKQGVLEQKGLKLELVLEKIIQVDGIRNNILLIGRYGFDASNLGRTSCFLYDKDRKKLISKKYPHLNLSFMTAHSSKGLTYDNVVIINAANEIYGFPAQIDDDPVMNLVTYADRSYAFAEERRLFYVAMTRTRNRVFIIVPKLKPSAFILELMKYPNVIVHGKIETDYQEVNKFAKRCPICGYHLQFRMNKNYGFRLYICTNEPEVCDFMTNDLNGGAASIKICPDCKDGFLTVKKKRNEDSYFLGCINYNSGKGCLKTEHIKHNI
ncbi:MAG: 3'-5' exonuclease, partial [Bacilli bacterium]|nr:3'-5' exonuclease [Bacilli bacterium]